MNKVSTSQLFNIKGCLCALALIVAVLELRYTRRATNADSPKAANDDNNPGNSASKSPRRGSFFKPCMLVSGAHVCDVLITGSASLNSNLAQSLHDEVQTMQKSPAATNATTKQNAQLMNSLQHANLCEVADNIQQMETLDKISHIVAVDISHLDTVHKPSLCLVNLLEAVNHKNISVIIVLPNIAMESVAAKSVEYTLLVYRSVYNLNIAVAYIPSIAEVWSTSLEVQPAQRTSDVVNFILDILKQDHMQEIYIHSSSNVAHEQNTLLWGKQGGKPLPLELCIENNYTKQECLNHIAQLESDESYEADFSSQDSYIFTTYLTSKKDPQRQQPQSPNDLNYIFKWLISVKALGLKAVIFHDGLGENFIHLTRMVYPKLLFHRVTNIGSFSLNDVRFIFYHDYLIRNPQIKRILCCDISDVVFYQNPFELMTLLGNHLYVGQDVQVKSMDDNGWFRGVANRCHADKTLPEYARVKQQRYFLNAGVIGGERLTMLDFLHKVNMYLRKTVTGKNCNMLVVNYVAQRYYHHAFFTGFPLTGSFGGKPNSIGVFMMHK